MNATQLLATIGIIVTLGLGTTATAKDCFIQGSLSGKSTNLEKKQAHAFISTRGGSSIWYVESSNVADFSEHFHLGDSVQVCRKWGTTILENRNNGINAAVFQP